MPRHLPILRRSLRLQRIPPPLLPRAIQNPAILPQPFTKFAFGLLIRTASGILLLLFLRDISQLARSIRLRVLRQLLLSFFVVIIFIVICFIAAFAPVERKAASDGGSVGRGCCAAESAPFEVALREGCSGCVFDDLAWSVDIDVGLLFVVFEEAE